MRELALRTFAGMAEIAQAGLSARRALDKAGNDETGFLQALHDRANAGKIPQEPGGPAAGRLCRRNWAGDIDRIWTACAY